MEVILFPKFEKGCKCIEMVKKNGGQFLLIGYLVHQILSIVINKIEVLWIFSIGGIEIGLYNY
jgi:hypothetical protein